MLPRKRSGYLLRCAAMALLVGLPPRPAWPQSWSYLQNDSVKIGVRLDLGAGVAFFGRTSTGRNLLNHADHGRLLQQSFYGSKDSSTWNGKPWRWNPVQGGCWTGKVAGIVQDFKNDGRSIYARTKPINWGGCDEIDAVMEEWIELAGNVAVIRFRFTNHIRDNANNTGQEMPAVFADYALPNLVYYDGASPWTNAPLTRKVPGWPNSGSALPENWAAYVDAKDWGLGVYAPGTSRMTFYRYPGDGKTGPDAGACSYFSPLRDLSVVKGFSIEYKVYVTIGPVPAIREEFRHIRETGRPKGGSVPIRMSPKLPGISILHESARDFDLLGRTGVTQGPSLMAFPQPYGPARRTLPR